MKKFSIHKPVGNLNKMSFTFESSEANVIAVEQKIVHTCQVMIQLLFHYQAIKKTNNFYDSHDR